MTFAYSMTLQHTVPYPLYVMLKLAKRKHHGIGVGGFLCIMSNVFNTRFSIKTYKALYAFCHSTRICPLQTVPWIQNENSSHFMMFLNFKLKVIFSIVHPPQSLSGPEQLRCLVSVGTALSLVHVTPCLSQSRHCSQCEPPGEMNPYDGMCFCF